MKDFIKFIKSSGIYFIGNVLIKMISLILLPVYTKYIPPNDFGTYDVSIAYVTFLCSVLFLDIWNGIMRFMFDYDSIDDKSKAIHNGGIIFILSSIIYTVLIIIIGRIYNINYLWWIYLYGILLNVQNLFSYIVRGFGKTILFASAGLVGTIITIACNIFFLVYLKMDYSVLYISACLGFAANILILLSCKHIIKSVNLVYFDKALFKKILFFSLPLCLNSLAYWFLTSYNRVVISNKLSFTENGYYSVAGKFASVIALFTSSFQMAWQELSFSKNNQDINEASKFYSEAINLYIKVLCMGVLLLIPVICVAFPYMVNEAYIDSKGVIPLYLLATVASFVSVFIGNIFGAIKKTANIFTTTLVSSIINVVIINAFIGLLGLQAANISLLVGFLANIFLRIRLLNKQLKIRIDYKFLVIYSLLFIGVNFAFIELGIIQNLLVFIAAIFASVLVFRKYIVSLLTKLKLGH